MLTMEAALDVSVSIVKVDSYFSLFFFFSDTATTEIYTLSLHDALPISALPCRLTPRRPTACRHGRRTSARTRAASARRSEEHTSELQSHSDLVCRLLLEKKKNKIKKYLTRRNKLTPEQQQVRECQNTQP